MFDSFSYPARRTVFWARHEAGRLGSDFIGLEHLLLGILIENQRESQMRFRDQHGTAIALEEPRESEEPFFSSDVAESLRHSIMELITPGPPKADSGDMPLSEESISALSAAWNHAGHEKVDILQLLWGLLSIEHSSIARLLTRNGVSRDQVEQSLKDRHGE